MALLILSLLTVLFFLGRFIVRNYNRYYESHMNRRLLNLSVQQKETEVLAGRVTLRIELLKLQQEALIKEREQSLRLLELKSHIGENDEQKAFQKKLQELELKEKETALELSRVQMLSDEEKKIKLTDLLQKTEVDIKKILGDMGNAKALDGIY